MNISINSPKKQSNSYEYVNLINLYNYLENEFGQQKIDEIFLIPNQESLNEIKFIKDFIENILKQANIKSKVSITIW